MGPVAADAEFAAGTPDLPSKELARPSTTTLARPVLIDTRRFRPLTNICPTDWRAEHQPRIKYEPQSRAVGAGVGVPNLPWVGTRKDRRSPDGNRDYTLRIDSRPSE
jgi:hypothetical protein